MDGLLSSFMLPSGGASNVKLLKCSNVKLHEREDITVSIPDSASFVAIYLNSYLYADVRNFYEYWRDITYFLCPPDGIVRSKIPTTSNDLFIHFTSKTSLVFDKCANSLYLAYFVYQIIT